MKLLRKQTDLPFLLAVGVLLILSASFLAVQLWSDGKANRGAAEALEAPVMPKAMEISRKATKKKKPGSPDVISEKTVTPKPVVKEMQDDEEIMALDDPEASDEPEVAVVESVELVDVAVEAKAENGKKALEKPTKAAGVKMAARPVEKAKVAPAVVKPAPVNEPEAPVVTEESKPSESVAMVSEPVKAVEKEAAVKEPRPTKKAKRARASRKIEEDATVVPPEWNWFSTPLKAELREGQVEIVAAVDFKPMSVAIEAKKPVIKKVVKSYQEEAVVVEKKTEARPAVAPASSRPFSAALARMAKIRQMREARDVARTEVSRGTVASADVVRVSPSLRRVNDLLQQLKAKLDKVKVVGYASGDSADASVDITEYEEAAPVQYISGGADEGDSTEGFESYYSGSGSSFSMRINDLMRRGHLFRD